MNLSRYGVVYVLTAAVASLALWGLAMAGINIPASGLSIVPVLVAAMNEGRIYATAHRAMPQNSAAWRFSWQAMLVGLIMQAIAAAVGLYLYPDVAQAFASAGQSTTLWLLVLLALFVCGVTVFSNKLFLSMGAKNALKVFDPS